MNVVVTVDFANGDAIAIDYTKPGSNPITNLYGEEVATFADQSVTNNIIAELPTGLIGHWKLNGDAEDSSGNNYDLTNTNGTYTTNRDSQSNKAIQLQTNAYIERDPFTEAQLQEFTACFWFKANALATNDIFLGYLLHTSYANGWVLYYDATAGKLKFGVMKGSGGVVVEKTFSDTTNWHFVMLSYKKTAASDNVKFSIDDDTPVTANYTGTIGYGTEKFQSGRSYTGYANFKIDGIMLFNKQLSAAEITSVYGYDD